MGSQFVIVAQAMSMKGELKEYFHLVGFVEKAVYRRTSGMIERGRGRL